MNSNVVYVRSVLMIDNSKLSQFFIWRKLFSLSPSTWSNKRSSLSIFNLRSSTAHYYLLLWTVVIVIVVGNQLSSIIDNSCINTHPIQPPWVDEISPQIQFILTPGCTYDGTAQEILLVGESGSPALLDRCCRRVHRNGCPTYETIRITMPAWPCASIPGTIQQHFTTTSSRNDDGE